MVEECFYRRLTTASWRPWAVTVRVLDSMAEQESGRRTCKGLSAGFFIGAFGCSEENMCMVRAGAAAKTTWYERWLATESTEDQQNHRYPALDRMDLPKCPRGSTVKFFFDGKLLGSYYFSLQANYNITRPCTNYLLIFSKRALFIGYYYSYTYFVFHIFFF